MKKKVLAMILGTMLVLSLQPAEVLTMRQRLMQQRLRRLQIPKRRQRIPRKLQMRLQQRMWNSQKAMTVPCGALI